MTHLRPCSPSRRRWAGSRTVERSLGSLRRVRNLARHVSSRCDNSLASIRVCPTVKLRSVQGPDDLGELLQDQKPCSHTQPRNGLIAFLLLDVSSYFSECSSA